MASGSGERPLGTPVQEKSLLGIDGVNGIKRFEVPNSTTRYLVFSSGYKAGLLTVGGYGSSYDNKAGLYVIDSGSTAALRLVTVKAPTQSGLTITPIDNTVIQITNPSGYLWVGVMTFYGTALSLETTQPT